MPGLSKPGEAAAAVQSLDFGSFAGAGWRHQTLLTELCTCTHALETTGLILAKQQRFDFTLSQESPLSRVLGSHFIVEFRAKSGPKQASGNSTNVPTAQKEVVDIKMVSRCVRIATHTPQQRGLASFVLNASSCCPATSQHGSWTATLRPASERSQQTAFPSWWVPPLRALQPKHILFVLMLNPDNCMRIRHLRLNDTYARVRPWQRRRIDRCLKQCSMPP